MFLFLIYRINVPIYRKFRPCLHFFQGDSCYIKEVPFRGVPCSDAAGSQVGYGSIVDDYEPLAVGSIKYNNISKSPFFTFKASILSLIVLLFLTA